MLAPSTIALSPVPRETILVVDDNTENLILLELCLAEENFLVRTAINALDALKALSENLPDLLLTDIQMSDIDGLELIRRVRSNPNTKDLFTVAVSANAMKEDIELAYQAGCDDYITKPVDTRTFAASVRERLQTRRHGTGKPAKSDLPESPHGDFLRSALLDLRGQIGQQLLSKTMRPSWREEVCALLHQCAGTAGALGQAQIAARARNLVAESATANDQEFAHLLGELADLLV